MLRQSCPSPESLLETISIPAEMGVWKRTRIRIHTVKCQPCQAALSKLRSAWDGVFQPEPEVASSVLRVYSRLQRDETLILKGWKLGDFRGVRPPGWKLFMRAWGFPTGIAVALGLMAVVFSPAFRNSSVTDQQLASNTPQIPLSPIRVREGNAVRIRYVQPELLHSMEFETVSTAPVGTP